MTNQTRNTSGIAPCGHYILIEPEEVEKKTQSGIILVDETVENAEREVTQGKLVAIGHTGWNEFGDGTPWAKVGDTVCFGKFAGRDMTGKDGKRYVAMNVEDILAVLD